MIHDTGPGAIPQAEVGGFEEGTGDGLLPRRAPGALTSEALEAEALRRLLAFRGRLGPELGAAFDALAARLRLFEGRDGAGYFSHPMALPVLELPAWAAALAARRGSAVPPGRALAAVEAAVVGYLHVRVEDDQIDEGIGEPGEAMLLSGALLGRHQALLASLLPAESAFWPLFEEIWLGYAEAMLQERRLHRRGGALTGEVFRQVLGRSRPLALPAAAVLLAAGRGEDVAGLERLVAALAAAHQLFADLVHAEKDRALGNNTYALWRLAAFGAQGDGDGGDGAEGAALLRTALFARGGFDALLDEARQALSRAEQEAAALGMPEAARFLERRRRYMAEIQAGVWRALFAGGAPAGGADP